MRHSYNFGERLYLMMYAQGGSLSYIVPICIFSFFLNM